MKSRNDDFERQIIEQLERLRPTPTREPERAAHTRTDYLSQIKTLYSQANANQAVSETALVRLNGWISQIFGPFARKERYAMVQVLTALVVTVSVLFGGTGATVYAAQDSLPTDFLYPVKIASEDILLGLTANPQSQLDLVLNYSDRRVGEIFSLAQMGEAIPPEVIDRLQSEMELTLLLVSEMEEPELSSALEKVGNHIRQRDRDMLQAMTNLPEDSQAAFAQIRAQLMSQNRVVDEGLESPYKFKFHQRHQEQYNKPVATESVPVTATETISDTEGIIMEGQGPGPAAGPGPGEPLGPEAGPGSEQGPGPQAGPGSEGESGPEAGPGPNENPGSQPGPGPYGPAETTESPKSKKGGK